MDFTTSGVDFYLSSLEEETRSETGDLLASLTRTSEGRVSVNISEDVLEDFLRGLQALKEKADNNNLTQETKQRRREVHNLKAKLKHTQAKYDLLMVETNDLRANIEKLCGTMRETLEHQTSEGKNKLDQARAENKALREKVEKLDKVSEKLNEVTDENEILRSQLEAVKLELRVEKHLRATAENNIELTAHSLTIQLFDKDTAEFEARSKADQLEADLAFERAQTQTAQEKLKKLQKSFAKHREDAERSAAQAQDAYRAQREELTKISLSLKKAENLIQTKMACIEEKHSLLETATKTKELYMSQLEEEKRERENILTAFQEERVQWQEERCSLVQANDSLTETMQYKEQEWEETNEIMHVHLKGLNAYIAQKMRRRKWWERLLP